MHLVKTKTLLIFALFLTHTLKPLVCHTVIFANPKTFQLVALYGEMHANYGPQQEASFNQAQCVFKKLLDDYRSEKIRILFEGKKAVFTDSKKEVLTSFNSKCQYLRDHSISPCMLSFFDGETSLFYNNVNVEIKGKDLRKPISTLCYDLLNDLKYLKENALGKPKTYGFEDGEICLDISILTICNALYTRLQKLERKVLKLTNHVHSSVLKNLLDQGKKTLQKKIKFIQQYMSDQEFETNIGDLILNGYPIDNIIKILSEFHFDQGDFSTMLDINILCSLLQNKKSCRKTAVFAGLYHTMNIGTVLEALGWEVVYCSESLDLKQPTPCPLPVFNFLNNDTELTIMHYTHQFISSALDKVSNVFGHKP